jgi:hypothetical protein
LTIASSVRALFVFPSKKERVFCTMQCRICKA